MKTTLESIASHLQYLLLINEWATSLYFWIIFDDLSGSVHVRGVLIQNNNTCPDIATFQQSSIE